MSETVTYAGKIKEVELNGNSLLDVIKALAVVHGNADAAEFGDDYYDIMEDHLSKKYEIVNDRLFEFIDLKKFDDGEGINVGSRNLDGTIDFITQYYNGSCCLSEALEEVLKDAGECEDE